MSGDEQEYFTRGKRKARWNLSTIIHFLDAIREHPVLWDVSLAQYMDRVLSLSARNAVARDLRELGIKANERVVALKLRNVKDRINDELCAIQKGKTATGKAAGQRHRVASWFHHASFMYDAVRARPSVETELQGVAKGGCQEEVVLPPALPPGVPSSSNIGDVVPSPALPNAEAVPCRRKRLPADVQKLASVEKAVQYLNAQHTRSAEHSTSCSNVDEVEAFCAWLTFNLRRLMYTNRLALQLQLMQSIQQLTRSERSPVRSPLRNKDHIERNVEPDFLSGALQPSQDAVPNETDKVGYSSLLTASGEGLLNMDWSNIVVQPGQRVTYNIEEIFDVTGDNKDYYCDSFGTNTNDNDKP